MQVIVSGHVILDPTVLQIKSMTTKSHVINLIICLTSFILTTLSDYIAINLWPIILGALLGALVVNSIHLFLDIRRS